MYLKVFTKTVLNENLKFEFFAKNTTSSNIKKKSPMDSKNPCSTVFAIYTISS